MNVVFCGPAGAGKKKLIAKLKEQCKRHFKDKTVIINVANSVLSKHGISSRMDYRCDDQNFFEVQRDIILSQCSKEINIEGREFVTDNCIFTALVLLEKCIGEGSSEAVWRTCEVIECIEKYKRSLILFLWPVNYEHDDDKCLKLSPELWSEVRETYLKLFQLFHIPVLEIKSRAITERISIVKEAMKGEIPLESSTLLNYDPKLKEENRIIPSHFSFFLKKCKKENFIEIPTIELSEHTSKQEWTSYKTGETNKFISKEGHGKLILLKFNISVKATIAQRILLGGVFVNGLKYSFLGCSASGLKTRKCFMWQGTSDEVKEILQRHGDFNSIKTVSKRLARIGLLFSGVTLTNVKIEDEDIVVSEDITTRDGTFNFTDGCGGIGKALAKQLASTVDADVSKKKYTPAVFQVRLQGYKGVLALDRELPDRSVMIRPSMKKFECTKHPYIGVCDFSKPYTFGHLNKQFIMLLSGLGIEDEVFEEKQEKHLNTLSKMTIDSESAIHMLQWQNMFDLAQRINEVGGIDNLLQEEKESVKRRLKQLQTSMVSKVEKLNILITESRNIFGVCDPTGTLKYGQCFLRLTISGYPKTIRGQVVVLKNPCYLLGDVRVLTAVDETDNKDIEKLHHLVDCIVFPTRGKRPHSNEIAGSDLDGDQYFVTWDKQLIPKSVRPPYDYPGADSKPMTAISEETIISYFARQNETQKLTARVDKYFNMWADLKGVKSTECERLGQLFSQVIDASKTGKEIEIPKGLEPSDDMHNQVHLDSVKFVWNRMHQRAMSFTEEFTPGLISRFVDRSVKADRCVSEDFVQDFAQRTYSNISEYEKFLFLWNYECRHGLTDNETLELFMEDFADDVNFSVFSVEERICALDKGIPSKILLNALNCSNIVSEDELSYFKMDIPLNTWRRYVILKHNSFDWSFLLKALTTNDNTLLVFKMPDDVILEIQILEKLNMGQEQAVTPGTITGLFYSRHFGYKMKYILGEEYFLDLTRDTFQLYRNRKKNLTFVWLNATDRKKVKGYWNKRVCDEVRNALSVDLQRFYRRIFEQGRTHPLINKAPFVMIEVYAQNCNGDIPYWDIYDVNDNLPVAEEMDIETGSGTDFMVDFECAFPKKEIEIELSSEEDLCRWLKTVACDGNPFTFRSVLENWLPRKVPNEAIYPLTEMFDNLVQKVVPFSLPEDMKTSLSEIIVIMSDVMKAPVAMLSVLSILCRLELNDLKTQLLEITLAQVTQSEYVQVLENWHSFVFLDTKSALIFAEQLLLSWTATTDSCENVTCDQTCLQLYVRNYGILHLLDLLFEIEGHMHEYEKGTNENIRNISSEKQTSITYLKVDTTADKEISTICFYRTGSLEQTRCKFKGQFVLISKQNMDQYGPEKQPVCVGQIETLSTAPCAISIKICNTVPDILLHSVKSDKLQYWRLDLIGNIVMFQRIVFAFKEIVSGTIMNDTLALVIQSCKFCPHRARSSYKYALENEAQNVCMSSDVMLNDSQKDAIRSALIEKACIILGPPGTGKTEVACQIIRHVVDMKKYKGILAVAETNVAVDNLTRRLRNHVSVVRVGPVEGVDNDLYDVSLEGQVAIIADREAKKAKVRDEQGKVHNNTQLINRVLAAADVVLTTCAGAGDSRLESIPFPFVLVDEATQTKETTLLCSLIHGAEHLVMIGDPKQLGPVVKECPKECKSPNLPDTVELSSTLFHRWCSQKMVQCCFLNVQHRMHQDIMKFPSVEFYENKLKAAESVGQRCRIIFPWPSPKPLCFVNVSGRERKSGTSYSNQEEVDVIGKVIDVLLNVDEEALREHRIAVHQIGIITLYQGQVLKLKDKIKNGVKISTVDGFQGQEKDVIVVSTVRCNETASLGFSDDSKRLNVLLTRAKRGLIVVGNKTTLSSSQIWARWLKEAPELFKEAIEPVRIEAREAKRYSSKGSGRRFTKKR